MRLPVPTHAKAMADELLNKQGDRFNLTFGPQIPWEHLTGDPQAVTDHLRAYVEDILPNDPEKPFEPLTATDKSVGTAAE